MPVNDLIQVRRDTAATWASVNPMPVLAEICLETDTRKLKFGNGTTAYNSLPYSRADDLLTHGAVFDASGDKLVVTATFATAGSILMTFRPNWAHTDGVDHFLWHGQNGGFDIAAEKFSDNKIYIGVHTGPAWIVVDSGNYAFNAFQVHTLVYTWNDTANAQEVFVDGVSEGTAATAFSLTAPTAITIGNNVAATRNFDGKLYHAAMLDRVITSAEAIAYHAEAIPAATSGNFSLSFRRGFIDTWNNRTIANTGTIITP